MDKDICAESIVPETRQKLPIVIPFRNKFFKGATMEEVAVMLDRLYNVKVRFASEKVKHYRFSGVIKNNSLDNVIELISLTAPIMYKKVGGEIIIEERK